MKKYPFLRAARCRASANVVRTPIPMHASRPVSVDVTPGRWPQGNDLAPLWDTSGAAPPKQQPCSNQHTRLRDQGKYTRTQQQKQARLMRVPLQVQHVHEAHLVCE